MQDAVEQLRNEVKKLQLELRAMRSENKLLRQKLDAMARRMFGRKTEQLNSPLKKWQSATNDSRLI